MKPELTGVVAEEMKDKKEMMSEDSDTTSMSTEITECSSESEDPWNVIDGGDDIVKWSDLSILGKIWRVSWMIIRCCIVLGLLYLFVCSLDILQDAFQLLSGRAAGNLFTSSVMNNPVCGLMIGVLVTVLVQSSSTSTSIIVSLVGAGVLGVRQSIPIIMGANIGTTVTNTIVALTQSTERNTFRRSFAGATVHDMFNWMSVLILLPIETATGYLYYMTKAMVGGLTGVQETENPQFLKVITNPLTELIVEVDKNVIIAIAEGTDRQKWPLVEYYCKPVTEDYAMNFTEGAFNHTAESLVRDEIFTYDVMTTNQSGYDELTWTGVLDSNSTKCHHLFVGSGLPGAALSEAAVGAILLVGSLTAMILCLIVLVKILNSMLRGPLQRVVKKAINADFPGYAAFLTGYVAMIVGAGVTVLVQSSSVFTSAMTPLVGIGVVTVERMYPLTLGANIGTTVTGLLAAFTADADMVQYTLQIALCHLFFNISGIIIWYPIPILRRVPIRLAKYLGNTTADYRWFAVAYLIILYFLVPLAVFGLSLAGWYVLLAVAAPIAIIVIAVIVINVLRSKRPGWLPVWMRSWDWLPKPLRSLEPYDCIIMACVRACRSERCCCSCCRPDVTDESSDASTNEKPELSLTEVIVVDDLTDACINPVAVFSCGVDNLAFDGVSDDLSCVSASTNL